jgi:hypothetical protein
LDMRSALVIYKPAVITQKPQRFPDRHSVSIRVIYTCFKEFSRKFQFCMGLFVLAGSRTGAEKEKDGLGA